MLELKNITKIYRVGNGGVVALNNVSVKFRDNEFVSVLGPSGCGKTTLLNIIGGLDKYTQGDLLIDDKSTQYYKDIDWDSYRNSRIGFVFQSYNLIPHQTILGNVELALTLSGINKSERKRRAQEALEKVGLGEQINKKPNQLSGGQLQRVAIARAIVNDPHIILADEPTGALDSKTSVQIMELLKEIASDRLVIMVTHNNELANNYSTRIIKLLDGKIVDDSDPLPVEPQPLAPVEAPPQDKLTREEKRELKQQRQAKKLTQKKTSMSFFTENRKGEIKGDVDVVLYRDSALFPQSYDEERENFHNVVRGLHRHNRRGVGVGYLQRLFGIYKQTRDRNAQRVSHKHNSDHRGYERDSLDFAERNTERFHSISRRERYVCL